jgi:hypothetical protein
MAIGNLDGSVSLWDPEMGMEIDSVLLRSAKKSIIQVAYSPDGRYRAVSHNDGLVSLLRLAAVLVKKP